MNAGLLLLLGALIVFLMVTGRLSALMGVVKGNG